jgi:hypothetical protein
MTTVGVRCGCVFVSATLLLSPALLGAQSPAPSVPATALPQSSFQIQTAPYIALRLNMIPQMISDVGSIVAPNAPIVVYNVSPRSGVRTLSASVARIGTYPASVPANTALFEVGLEGLNGYCAPLTADQGVRQAQCFIDVNNDNKFDASYITNRAWQGTRLYWGQVARLASIPPVAYEASDVSTIAPEPLSFYFRRIRDKKAEFQMAFGPRNNGVPIKRCLADGVTPCRLGGHSFTFEASGPSLKIVSASAAGDQMDLVTDR